MINPNHYVREDKNVLKKENSEAEFTVRLHFAENYKNEKMIEEIQEILFETYMRNLNLKGSN